MYFALSGSHPWRIVPNLCTGCGAHTLAIHVVQCAAWTGCGWTMLGYACIQTACIYVSAWHEVYGACISYGVVARASRRSRMTPALASIVDAVVDQHSCQAAAGGGGGGGCYSHLLSAFSYCGCNSMTILEEEMLGGCSTECKHLRSGLRLQHACAGHWCPFMTLPNLREGLRFAATPGRVTVGRRQRRLARDQSQGMVDPDALFMQSGFLKAPDLCQSLSLSLRVSSKGLLACLARSSCCC